MPQQIQPPSLRQASIDNIVYHFDDYWCAGVTSNLLEDSDQPDVMTPFQYLRDDMIQEIIDKLSERKSLRQHHFQLLLHSNIRRLNLDDCRMNVDENVMKTLGTRCQKLTHLNMRELGQVKPEQMCTLIRNLPHIISLDICLTGLDTNSIKVISGNCPNLLDLDVTWYGSPDIDFLYLCDPTHGKPLPKLRKLSFYPRKTDTVVRLLQSHSTLRSLDGCKLTDHAFEQMYGDKFQSLKDVSPEWIHNLLEITIDGSSGEESKLSEADRLDLTFQCCPFLTKVNLRDIKEPQSVKHVCKLKHLKNICITMFEEKYNCSLYMLSTLLSTIGENLTSLKCRALYYGGVNEVSLLLIGKLCVNLETLDLEFGNIMHEHVLIEGNISHCYPYFTKLSVINLLLREPLLQAPRDTNTHLSLPSLLLLNATELRKMIFYGVDCLTDKIMSEANRKHGFKHLRKCCLYQCPSITVESMWELLCPDNPLEELGVYGCQNITQKNMELVQQEARLRQFDINLEFRDLL